MKIILLLSFIFLMGSCATSIRPTLIVSAVKGEQELIRKQLDVQKESSFGNIKWSEGKIYDLSVVVSLVGVGKTNTGMVLGYLIKKFNPKQIIMVGTAARVKRKYRAGDVFIVSEADFHDWGNLKEDGMVQGTSIWGLTSPAPKGPFFPDKNLRNLALKAAETYRPSEKIKIDDKEYYARVFTQAKTVSGDLFSVNKWKMKEIREEFKADIFEMETASLGLVAYHTKIPWIAFRGGNDLIQAGDASDDYKKYGPIARKQAALFALHFF